MILGLGVDLVQIARIRRLRETRGDRFLLRVYTTGELASCADRRDWAERLAARFAAKEAGMKALGTGWGLGVGWQHLEVVSTPSGPPRLALHAAAADRAAALGVARTHLSLTHDGGVAGAVVVLEGERERGTPPGETIP